VYNGPFVVKNWEQSQKSWDLQKNKNYHSQKEVKADKIHYETVNDSNTILNLYKTEKLDVAILSGSLASENRNQKDFQANSTGIISYIRLNQERDGKKAVMANENLRKAFALGIDKEKIIDKIVADGSTPLYGLIPENFEIGRASCRERVKIREWAGAVDEMKRDRG